MVSVQRPVPLKVSNPWVVVGEECSTSVCGRVGSVFGPQRCGRSCTPDDGSVYGDYTIVRGYGLPESPFGLAVMSTPSHDLCCAVRWERSCPGAVRLST